MLKVDETLRKLERAWEAGGLPGRQNCEHDAAWRQLWRELQRPPAGARNIDPNA
jgi:hypothetical protein